MGRVESRRVGSGSAAWPDENRGSLIEEKPPHKLVENPSVSHAKKEGEEARKEKGEEKVGQ